MDGLPVAGFETFRLFRGGMTGSYSASSLPSWHGKEGSVSTSATALLASSADTSCLSRVKRGRKKLCAGPPAAIALASELPVGISSACIARVTIYLGMVGLTG